MDAVDEGTTPLSRRRRSRSDRIGIKAAAEALADSGVLDGASIDRSRVGVFLGAGTADLLRNEQFYQGWIAKGLGRARRSDLWNHFPSTPVDVIASEFGFEGPRACVVAACSSSTIAIGRAVEAIRSGRTDAVLAGGTDALSRLTFTGFNLLRLMDSAPCRPFDRSRAGMNIGEGAGILVLERLDRARAPRRPHLRGAGRPRCRLRGVSPDGARAGRQTRGGGRRARAAGCGDQRRRRASRQCARHGDSSERRCRGARVSPRVWRPGRARFPSRRSSR